MPEEIFSLLKADHRRVSEMLEKLQRDSGDGKAAEGQFADLQRELELHSNAEEHAIYPRLAEHQETEGAAAHAQQEHNAIRAALKELETLSPKDEQFTAVLLQLREEVESHVAEEESTIFTKLRQLFDANELGQIAKEFTEAKAALGEGTLAA